MKQQEKNIKYQILKIKYWIKKSNIFNIFFISLILTVLFLNLLSSQLISPIYLPFVNNNKTATVSFLQKIKILPEYSRILEMNNNIFGPRVSEEIYAQENKKNEVIKNLEQQLTINPKARDVLYSLFQLTQDKKYLEQAKEVDPSIK